MGLNPHILPSIHLILYLTHTKIINFVNGVHTLGYAYPGEKKVNNNLEQNISLVTHNQGCIKILVDLWQKLEPQDQELVKVESYLEDRSEFGGGRTLIRWY